MAAAVSLPAGHANEDLTVHGEEFALIQPGEYTVQYCRHDTAVVFGVPKVFVRFKIVDIGKHLGMELVRPFRARELKGKPRRNGGFALGRRSELFLVLCRLYEQAKIRPDRVSLRDLKNVTLRVKVRTVDKDYRQRPLPEMVKYSVIGEILGIDAGSFLLEGD